MCRQIKSVTACLNMPVELCVFILFLDSPAMASFVKDLMRQYEEGHPHAGKIVLDDICHCLGGLLSSRNIYLDSKS